MFEDFRKKLAKFGQSAMKKTGEVAEIASLQTRVMGKKKKINDELLELGKKYYEAHKDESVEFTERIASVNTLYTEIEALENEIKTLKEKLPSGEMQEAAEEVVNDIKDAATEMADSFKEAVSGTAEEVKEAAEEAVDDAEEAVEEAADDVEEASEDSTETAAEEAEETVETAAEEAVDTSEETTEEM